jgi:ribosomal protein S18 acetylase RimI-like enzyme
MPVVVRQAAPENRNDIERFLIERWKSVNIAYNGGIYGMSHAPAFVAYAESQLVGLITLRQRPDALQMMTIDALAPGQGIGTALIAAAENYAREKGERRILVSTTNNNARGIAFYEKRGFRVHEVRPGAVAASRKLKPQIPEFDEQGLAITDEIDLIKDL